jgi:hypothetical protein
MENGGTQHGGKATEPLIKATPQSLERRRGLVQKGIPPKNLNFDPQISQITQMGFNR